MKAGNIVLVFLAVFLVVGLLFVFGPLAGILPLPEATVGATEIPTLESTDTPIPPTDSPTETPTPTVTLTPTITRTITSTPTKRVGRALDYSIQKENLWYLLEEVIQHFYPEAYIKTEECWKLFETHPLLIRVTETGDENEDFTEFSECVSEVKLCDEEYGYPCDWSLWVGSSPSSFRRYGHAQEYIGEYQMFVSRSIPPDLPECAQPEIKFWWPISSRYWTRIALYTGLDIRTVFRCK